MEILYKLEVSCRRNYSDEFKDQLYDDLHLLPMGAFKTGIEALRKTAAKLPTEAEILAALPKVERTPDQDAQSLAFINSDDLHFEEKMGKCLEIWRSFQSRPEQLSFWDGLSVRQKWFFAEAVKYAETGSVFPLNWGAAPIFTGKQKRRRLLSATEPAEEVPRLKPVLPSPPPSGVLHQEPAVAPSQTVAPPEDLSVPVDKESEFDESTLPF